MTVATFLPISLMERDEAGAAGAELLRALHAGLSGALFVIGEPGLGKTALLSAVGQRAAESGVWIGRGRGHHLDSSLSFGQLAQAFEELGAPELILEGPGAGPLAVPGGRPGAVPYAALRWLRARAADAGRPVLLVLDDLHWADTDSLALVSFLCRRFGAPGPPVAVLAALRPWPSTALDLAEDLVHDEHAASCRLAPLSPSATALFLAERTGAAVSAQTVSRAWRQCGGNPLLLGQFALPGGGSQGPATGPGGPAGPAGPADRAAPAGPRPVPPPARAPGGGPLLLARFAGMPPAGLRCVRAAAVLGAWFRSSVAAEVAGLEGPDAETALDALGRSGLFRDAPDGGTRFVHPQFRTAVYQDLCGPLRTRLHARAFASLADRGLDGEAAEHAIRAELVGDSRAVDLLERTGRQALRTGAAAEAADVLAAAVRLAGERATCELRLVLGEALLRAGRATAALRELERLAGVRATVTPDGDAVAQSARRLLADARRAAGRFPSGSRREPGTGPEPGAGRAPGAEREAGSELSALTAGETRVAREVATGHSNPQVAHLLSLSVKTVESHLERVYAKLAIHSRAELIALAAVARWPLPGS
jgi:DNA-binding CsgD family transcriptional regulator/predicted ATPase